MSILIIENDVQDGLVGELREFLYINALTSVMRLAISENLRSGTSSPHQRAGGCA